MYIHTCTVYTVQYCHDSIIGLVLPMVDKTWCKKVIQRAAEVYRMIVEPSSEQRVTVNEDGGMWGSWYWKNGESSDKNQKS